MGEAPLYFELCGQPAVGRHAEDRRPALVVDDSGSRVLWANAAGAALLGIGAVSAFGEERIGDAATRRHLAALAREPAASSPVAALRLTPSRPPLPCRVERIMLSRGAPATVVVGPSPVDVVANPLGAFAALVAGDGSVRVERAGSTLAASGPAFGEGRPYRLALASGLARLIVAEAAVEAAQAVGAPPPGPEAARAPVVAPPPDRTRLSRPEREAFRQIAEALGARFDESSFDAQDAPVRPPPSAPAGPPPSLSPAEQSAAIVLDRMPSAAALLREGVVVFANRAMLELFGMSDAASLARAGPLLPALTDPQAGLKRLDGTPLAVRPRLHPVALGGSSLGLIVLEPEQAAAPAGATDAALAEAVKQAEAREAAMAAGKRQAETASALKSEFLARISHEVRTPLNAILGFSELMLAERYGPVASRYLEYLRDIRLSASHIISLVNDLLDLSKVESGRIELAPERVDLAELLHDCAALVQPEATGKRVLVRVSAAAATPAARADLRSVRQIALNLLANALKFTPPGGQIVVSAQPGEAEGTVTFRVRDSGAGMSREEVARVLAPFHEGPTGRSRTGTGLGLPLSKALAEANGGALAIQSAPGEGTTVEVTLPAE